MRTRSGWRVWLVAGALLAGCDDATGPDGGARFEVEVSGERFVVHVADATQRDSLQARLASGYVGVISGEITAGNGGFNAPWGWHMVPETVHTAEMAVELCDGRPALVEADLGYWLGTVKRFCPWGAKVVRRIR